MNANISSFEQNLKHIEFINSLNRNYTPSNQNFDDSASFIFRYLFSYHSRFFCRELFLKNSTEPSKAFRILNKKKSVNKFILEDANFSEENTTLSFSGMKGNGSLPSFKQKTYSSLSFLDLADCLILSTDIFKRIQKFKQLTILCLHDCGMLLIPPELCRLTPTLKTLDLSLNYISSIPNDIHWEQIEGINLSNNAFNGWPNHLNSTKFPNLTYLNLSHNRIMNCQASHSFLNLQFLDLSYCALINCPEWILQSKCLSYLSLNGNTGLWLPGLNFLEPMKSLRRIDISGVNFIDKCNDTKLPMSLEIVVARSNTFEFIPEGNYTIIHD